MISPRLTTFITSYLLERMSGFCLSAMFLHRSHLQTSLPQVRPIWKDVGLSPMMVYLQEGVTYGKTLPSAPLQVIN